ncbi:MAG: TIGR03087 family PEP-CTERM/XrtA system glycosyltransferase [Alphaproteobacteria bacterium]|nr:TIGR03087 family PEP-CTERM/XrtA system glycosyltransferase [Alphaproteobacteria bacterium]MBV9371247.1 TIGR03087 family PEP-CTERM/XrtA system glycosyltransferase [Alphaproteobacteria bacterium]MBV9902814.1 TIGR03087 family PEP-CTERM/XrtA system glycosyltransferase [Alphaproteobacteria bacterium]
MTETLFLAHRIPYPPDRGDKIRSWHLLRHLAGLGPVHLACFADDEADAAHLPALREALGGRLGAAHVEVRRTGRASAAARALLAGKPLSLTLFDSPTLRAFVDQRLADPKVEALFVFSGQMAQFAPARLRQRLVMDFVDMDSAKFAAYAAKSGPLAWLYRREAAKLFAFERETAARADASLFVSDAEAALFRARTGLPNVAALQNGVDLDFYDPRKGDTYFSAEKSLPPSRPLIVFTGQMDYAPNVDAVAWFAAEVLPRLPGAGFAIVGRNPVRAVRRLASDRVIVTGAVPDVRAWLAAADVVAAPLRIARGVQNKVLEAMAMGRPVVASPAAFEGIEAEPGRDLIVADGAPAQAEAIAALLADPARAAALAAAARRRMEEAYRWDARLAPLAELVLPVREAQGEGDQAKPGGGAYGAGEAPPPRFARSPSPSPSATGRIGAMS